MQSRMRFGWGLFAAEVLHRLHITRVRVSKRRFVSVSRNYTLLHIFRIEYFQKSRMKQTLQTCINSENFPMNFKENSDNSVNDRDFLSSENFPIRKLNIWQVGLIHIFRLHHWFLKRFDCFPEIFQAPQSQLVELPHYPALELEKSSDKIGHPSHSLSIPWPWNVSATVLQTHKRLNAQGRLSRARGMKTIDALYHRTHGCVCVLLYCFVCVNL